MNDLAHARALAAATSTRAPTPREPVAKHTVVDLHAARARPPEEWSIVIAFHSHLLAGPDFLGGYNKLPASLRLFELARLSLWSISPSLAVIIVVTLAAAILCIVGRLVAKRGRHVLDVGFEGTRHATDVRHFTVPGRSCAALTGRGTSATAAAARAATRSAARGTTAAAAAARSAAAAGEKATRSNLEQPTAA